VQRLKENPLITKQMITPSQANFSVCGVFNCGATIYNKQIVLLLRVAESYIQDDPTKVIVPQIDPQTKKTIAISFDKTDSRYDFSDSRVIKKHKTTVALTSLSHLRRAYSDDGINFVIDDKPWIEGDDITEIWGVEDPRITKISNNYFITYTAVSNLGIFTNLIKTTDFFSFERLGTLFVTDNKDVAIFPEKIKGKYQTYHRPVPTDIGTPNIWLAKSPDLIHWGEHQKVLTVKDEGLTKGRVGAGAPSIKTPFGWLQIYHVADATNNYHLKALMTDLTDPAKIIAKTHQPLLKPERDYEQNGFFKNVVFANGIIERETEFIVYYGAADDKIAAAKIKKADLYERLGFKND